MKVNIENISGEIIRDNDVYVVQDNKLLNNLVLSQTRLKPGKETTGHSHDELEEVYFFNSGTGRMKLGDEILEVKSGDVVLIPGGVFHKVYNDSEEMLILHVYSNTIRDKQINNNNKWTYKKLVN